MHEIALWVTVVGLVGTVVGLALAGKRIVFLYRLITSGQPAPDRIKGVTGKIGLALKTQLVEVFGQRKLLKWSIPGAAHFFVFWAFLILGTVYLEAYGILISRNAQWHIPIVGEWDALGFAQDFIAIMAVVGIVVFWQIRLKERPSKLGRQSRFSGSHLGGAYLVLFMIFNVIWTMFLFRGAAAAGDNLPYGNGAFVSSALGKVLPESELLEGIGLLLHIGVMLVFLVEVVNSKHLHIFVAPINVMFGRRPVALGAVKSLISDGKPISLEDIDDLDEDAKLGVGSIEDFTWKGLLDMATCTECGRCQSQCPAWNTEKPLSPKMLILNLRDHAFARGEYTLADEDGRAKMLEGSDTLTKEVGRPLIGDESAYGVIDPDVLWSCVTCGACVEQCPVDIEHVDHIVDMRRYQVLVESNFPAELNQLFKGLENKGNPWNMSTTARMDWAKDLPFDVKVVGEDVESLDEVDWLFWVGCAGAYEDRAKKTTRAVAELLDMAGVSFAVLGNGETCTGDSARRAGNEFVFQGLAMQNVETFKEHRVKKVVSTCAHCFNTLKNEYAEFGIELEVVHHTQLLNRLVREGKLTPVTDGDGAHKRSITYHDPCYIGRHNGVYAPPRELLAVLPGASYVEMERNSERSFCCGAGGARMWMEENIGTRINENRTNEAIGTGADQIAVGCPFCRVMLSDGLTAAQDKGNAREEVEVLDVAQMLLASVKGVSATRRLPGGDVALKAEPEEGDATDSEDTVTEPADVGPAAKASEHADEAEADKKSGAATSSSLFDLGGNQDETTTEPVEDEARREPVDSEPTEGTEKAEAKKSPESSGGSLFDIAADEPAAKDDKPEPEPERETKAEAEEEPEPEAEEGDESPKADDEPAAEIGGGSLFDIAADEPAANDDKPEPEPEPETKAEAEDEPEPEAEEGDESPKADDEPAAEIGGGSLFDIAADEPPAKQDKPQPKTEPEPEPETEAKADPEPEAEEKDEPAAEIGSGSLFDIATPAPAESSVAKAEAEPEPTPEAKDESEAEPDAKAKDTSEAEDEDEPELTGGAAVSAAATAAASDAPTHAAEPAAASEPEEAAGDTEDDPEPEAADAADEPEPESDTQEKPKPQSSGATHEPKTDVDISGSGSLFDL